MKVENGALGAQTLEVADLTAGDGGEEAGEGEEEPVLALRFLDNVFAVVLDDGVRRPERRLRPSWDLRY